MTLLHLFLILDSFLCFVAKFVARLCMLCCELLVPQEFILTPLCHYLVLDTCTDKSGRSKESLVTTTLTLPMLLLDLLLQVRQVF